MTAPGTPGKPFPWLRGVIALGVLLAIGIGWSVTRSQSPNPEPTSAPTSAVSAAECLPVSESLIESIEQGLNPGYTLGAASAAVATQYAEAWFVAAVLEGPAIDAPEELVIVTNRDPSGDAIGMIIGVGGFAHQISNWPRGEDSEYGFSIVDDGADEARECLP